MIEAEHFFFGRLARPAVFRIFALLGIVNLPILDDKTSAGKLSHLCAIASALYGVVRTTDAVRLHYFSIPGYVYVYKPLRCVYRDKPTTFSASVVWVRVSTLLEPQSRFGDKKHSNYE